MRPTRSCGSLEMARVVVESVKLNPARPAAAAEESWVVATDLAEALARNGTPFHQAHQIAGRLVLESVRSGKKPADWTAEELAAFAPEFTPEMARLLRAGRRHEDARDSRRHGPGAVAAGAGRGAPARLRADERHEQELSPGPDSEADPRATASTRRKNWRRRSRRSGIAATQVTLSRDIRELRLVKTADGYRQVALAARRARRSSCSPPSSCSTSAWRRTCSC